MRIFPVFIAFFASLAFAYTPPANEEPIRIAYRFSQKPTADCEIELSRDSVRISNETAVNRLVGADTMSGTRKVMEIRALSSLEKDSIQNLLGVLKIWRGYKKYSCDVADGYGYSLWSDSLYIRCDNCYSCTDGLNLQEAKILERIGKLTLWLYKKKEALLTP